MSDKRTDIVVTGTGSLSAAVVYALMGIHTRTLRVSVMSRDTERLQWLVRSVLARARCLDIDLRIEAVSADWGTTMRFAVRSSGAGRDWSSTRLRCNRHGH